MKALTVLMFALSLFASSAFASVACSGSGYLFTTSSPQSRSAHFSGNGTSYSLHRDSGEEEDAGSISDDYTSKDGVVDAYFTGNDNLTVVFSGPNRGSINLNCSAL
jgi:hypothetical protein